MKRYLVSLFVLLSFVSFSSFADANYSIDAKKSSIKWTGKKVTGEHFGSIALESGKFAVEGNKVKSGEFVADMGSIKVGDLKGEWNEKLLNHLKSADFFDVANHKESKLKLKEIKQVKGDDYKVMADLTIKGKTKPVTFDAKIKVEGKNAMVKGKLVFDRTNYNIRYGSGKFFEDLGDKMIYDDVTLEFDIVAKGK